MKLSHSLAVAAVLLMASSAAQAQVSRGISGATGRTALEREVRAAEEQMHRAYVTGDVQVFASLYADDSTFTYNSGVTVTGKQRIEDFKKQAAAGGFKDLRDEIVSITTLGDAVALVRCTSRYSTQSRSGEAHLNILRVWHKRNGRWQVVAFQSTAVRPPAATPSNTAS
jgi:uncharacterized protein (TIGR02246 family)